MSPSEERPPLARSPGDLPRRQAAPFVAVRHAYETWRQLIRAALVLLALTLAGTLGYILIEGWSLRDAFFMTMITLTTVGYGEVRPLNLRGEILTVALLAGGVGAVLYTLNVLVRLTMEGEITGALGLRRMRWRIEHMHDHVILCGFGRVGQEIARTLASRGATFVVVDEDEDALERAAETGYDRVHGDARDDHTLREAGVEHAKCLIAALNSDADTSWVVLSARALNAKLWIVARADFPESEPKLRQAGADRTVSPPSIGGKHLALAAVEPTLLDFTESVVHTAEGDLTLAQLSVDEHSPLRDRSLADALGPHRSVTALGLRRANAELVVGPDLSTCLTAGDELILLGPLDDLDAISGLSRTGVDRA